MKLKESEKVNVVLELGKMEHDEEKIIYQFTIGGILSVSAAIIVGFIQKPLQ